MYRSERLLRAVSSLDCQICGISGMTQAAHANWGVYGKGMGQKAHDCFVAALCQHCHHEIDQGKELTKEERQQQWESAWRATLLALFQNGSLRVK
jgi:beta-glucanase (GH16 family)